VASPTPGGLSAVANEALVWKVGSATAPFGLVATIAKEFDSDDNFHWDGDEIGLEFGDSFIPCKSNNNVAFYPSCNHVVFEAILPVSVCPVPNVKINHDVSTILPLVCPPGIKLSKKLMPLFASMSTSSILPGSYHQFTVADSGATNHMFPDKLAFISYPIVVSAWETTLTFQFLVAVWQSFPSMASLSWSGTRFMCWGLQSLSTAFARTSPNQDVDSLVHQGLASWFIFRHLSCPLSHPRIAIFHSSLWDNLPRWTVFITSNLGVLLCFTPKKLPLTWRPNLRLLSKMTQLLMARMC
jgi:hypothetical protein